MLAALLIPAAIAAGLRIDPPDLKGTWRGTSICVDHATDTACKDEQVTYRLRSSAAHPDSIAMAAGKIIDGKEEPMGDLELGLDPKTGELAMVLTSPRFHGRWAFRIQGDTMTGTLVELPSGRLVRRVAAKRTRP